MKLACDGSTDPVLLRKVADWANHDAWVNFRDTYDPLMRRWCRAYGLNDDSLNEICQRIWIELARRIQSFEYDPSRTFRGWLRRLCESRVLNFLRQRKRSAILSLDERDDTAVHMGTGSMIEPDEMDDSDSATDQQYLLLLKNAARIQAAVKARIKPNTWDAFWLVDVYDWTVERAAQVLGMTHTAVYAAQNRVARMLSEEGNRMSDGAV
jgi:RNA polymerase sigma factor (sigma-70 family)